MQTITRLIVGSILAALLLLAAGLTGCATIDEFIKGSEKPEVRLVGGRLTDLAFDRATVALEVEVMNPYNVPLPVASADLSLASRDRSLVAASITEPALIPARGSRRFTLPVGVTFLDALAILTDIRPGAVIPYEAAADLKIDAPGLGLLSFPLKHTGEMPIPVPPTITIANITFDELTLSNARATITVNVTSINRFRADLERMGYALDLAGTRIASGAIEQTATLDAGETSVLRLPLHFAPRDFGTAIFQTLLSGEASYRLQGDFALDTPFGTLTAPYDTTGRAPLRR